MHSAQDILSFYKDWDSDPFEPAAHRDAAGRKPYPVDQFHWQVAPHSTGAPNLKGLDGWRYPGEVRLPIRRRQSSVAAP